MGDALKEWFEAALNLIYPRNIKCMLCENELFEREKYSLCEVCMEELYWLGADTCACCGRQLGVHSVISLCGDCSDGNKGYASNVSVAIYNDATRSLIFKLKYGDQRYVSYQMAHMMADRLTGLVGYLDKFDLMIPVPLHEKRVAERGYNQSELIGSYLAERIGIDLRKDVIIRNTYTIPQTLLNRFERKENLKGVFTVTNEAVILGKKILLIDDVFTTGSTVHEVSNELVKMGALEVHSITFAAASMK